MAPQDNNQNTDMSLPAVGASHSISPTHNVDANQMADDASSNQNLETNNIEPPLDSAPRPVSTVTSPADDDASHQPQGATADDVSNYPLIADDNDLIEKEWVLKAKEIVSKTANDPHKRNKEMSRFKSDYIKKRYNKDLKLIED